MSKFRRQPVAAAVSVLGMAIAAQALAQQAPAPAVEGQTVEVTGIRASILRSITAKREAPTNVEVITAEDVGKLPDKNIADALSRVPGVNVQFGGALAMDEAERVAIRGTSPNLNLVTLNGHALSSGDWHVGDQSSSGRSVGFGMMPSQLIGRSVVYKTGQADITEGGVAGTVDIQTRRPLDFKAGLTGEVALGAVYADLPKTTDPQLSGLIGFKNDAGTLGVLVQAFSEKRHLRRDGQETFSFGTISAAQATASGNAALAGKRMPGSLNSALFEGVRERKGGYIGVQFKPTKDLDLHLSTFDATLDADNYNSSAFALPTALVGAGWLISNAVIEGDVITSATLSRPTVTNANTNVRVIGLQFDHNQRQGARSKTAFTDLDFKWNASKALSIDGRVGTTKGSGVTNAQPSLTYGLINPNMSYTINTSRPTDYKLVNATGADINLRDPKNYVQMSNTGASVASRDAEDYVHLNGDLRLEGEVFTGLKFGVRTAKHTRSYDVIGPRWNAQDLATGLPVTPSPFLSVSGSTLVNFDALPPYVVGGLPTPPTVPAAPIVTGANQPVPATAYPGNYASGLDANFPRDLFRFDPAQLSAFAAKYVNWDPVAGKTWTSGYTVKEDNSAGYLMGEFEKDALSGNVGVRLVQTKVQSISYQALANGTAAGSCVPTQPCSVPGAIVGSRFATYIPKVDEVTHTNVLPSLNLRYALQRDLIARLGLSRTLGRPNYNELAGAVGLNNTLLTGSAGNPMLAPIVADNVDLSVGWYFAPRAYVAVGAFAQSLQNYVKLRAEQRTFLNTATGTDAVYTINTRYGTSATISGVEAALELPVGKGFGVSTNVTIADGVDADGMQVLGTSRVTYNVQGWFENDAVSARLAWNHRSDYAIGYVNNAAGSAIIGTHNYAGSGSLSASLTYRFTKNLSLTLDGNNLLNPVRHTYFLSANAPGYWHESGRQFYLNLRAKF